ncbi:MAG: putative DNA binding domain-containing protein [Anaerolineae bacterium]|nr:putative DNA binding domain-containing protein [Anaerolineae bacterium]
MSVTHLIGRRSGPQIECMPTVDAERLTETLVAFANTDGGHILLGVTPAGHVIGNLQEEEVEGALRHALVNCRPPVKTEWQLVSTGQGDVVGVFVPRSTELHSLADGRVIVRSGAQNSPLGGEQIRQLAATKSSSDFEAEPIAGATLADLDEAIITEYIEKREERQRRKLTLSRQELLVQIGALTPELAPTTVGILLFGRDPQVFLPHSGAVFVRFTGTEARGPQGLPGYGRREEIVGPLARLIERLWQIIWSEMRVQAVVRGLQREEKSEYPPFAVREALVSAVCHRDYRVRPPHRGACSTTAWK